MILGDFIFEGLSAICTTLADALNFGVQIIFQSACKVFNTLSQIAVDFFTKTPWDFAGTELWGMIENMNTVFVSIAASLVCVFWAIGFVQESVDAKSEMRLEQIIRTYIKISVVEFFVINSLSIVCWFFLSATNLSTLIFQGGSELKIDYAADLKGYLSIFSSAAGHTGLYSIYNLICNAILLIIGIVFLGVAVVSSVGILFAALKQFGKILILIPFGSLAASSMAGGPAIRRTAESFYRFAISSAFEVLAMILAIQIGVMCMKYSSAFGVLSPSEISGDIGVNLVEVLYALIIKSVVLLLVPSLIRQSEQVMQRIIG